ncbi:MAG: ATP-binding cassette domain-containing protein [Acidimicrobiales bacterium]
MTADNGPVSVRRLLLRVAGEVRGVLLLAALGAAVRQAGFLAAPYLLQFAVDDGVAEGDAVATAWWCAAIAAAAAVQFVGMCVWDYYANLADGRSMAWLVHRVRQGIIHHDHTIGAGDLVVRATRDVKLIRIWIHGLPTWIVISVTIIVLVPGLVALGPWLLVVALTTAPCLAALSIVYPRRFKRASGRAADAHSDRADVVDQIVRAGAGLRGIGAEGVVIERHRRASVELADRTVRASGVLARWTALGEGVPALATAGGVLIGAVAVLDGRLTVGGLVTFSGWMATVGIAVQVGLMRWTQSVDARVGAARLLPLMGNPRSDHDGPSPNRIEARGVEVFEGAAPVSFDVVPGRVVVVTGPIASGKSSLLRVLAGTQAPFRGELVVDGQPADDAPLPGVHIVPQRPLLLTGTVRDNLALGLASGDAARDEERFRWALDEVAFAAELTGREPNTDLLTVHVGEGGADLSGGQRQRLALARALVSDAPVLLLDDVSSAIDRRTTTEVVAALHRAAHHRIVVAASHDPALVASADEVIELRPKVRIGE